MAGVLAAAIGGPTLAQGDIDASSLARSTWAVDAEYVAEAEAMECDELTQGMDVAGWSALSVSMPELLNQPKEWDTEELGEDTVLSFVRARLALFAVVALEKRCFDLGDLLGGTADSQGSGGTADREAPVTKSGDGMQDTEAFQLDGGDYKVDVNATSTFSDGMKCFHTSSLQPTEGFGMEATVGLTPGEGKSESATTYVYDLDPGRYYWSVSSSCKWIITITPEG